MARFIIVEGNKCTGKTTLVEELRGTLSYQGWDTKSLAHRPGDQFQRYLQEYVSADRIVFNRLHYAEQVFGRLYRGGNPFSYQQLNVLEAVIKAYSIVIYCDLGIDHIKVRLDARNKTEVLNSDETSLKELEANADAFEEVFRHQPAVRYTARKPEDLRAILRKVERMI